MLLEESHFCKSKAKRGPSVLSSVVFIRRVQVYCDLLFRDLWPDESWLTKEKSDQDTEPRAFASYAKLADSHFLPQLSLEKKARQT